MGLYRLPADVGARGHVVSNTADKVSGNDELNIAAFATFLIGS